MYLLNSKVYIKIYKQCLERLKKWLKILGQHPTANTMVVSSIREDIARTCIRKLIDQ